MRGKYIYLVYQANALLAGFTVKHEAHSWVERQKLDYQTLKLVRMLDGGRQLPNEIEWEPELFNLRTGNFNDSIARAASEVADWPDYAQKCLRS